MTTDASPSPSPTTTTNDPLNLPDTIEWNGLTLRLQAGYGLPVTAHSGVFTMASSSSVPAPVPAAKPPAVAPERTSMVVLADLNAAREKLLQLRLDPGDGFALHDQHGVVIALEEELAAAKRCVIPNPK